MRYFFSTLVCLAWALWLGGLCTLFLVVTVIFRTLEGHGDSVGDVASAVFRAFEKYQLILAAVSLLTTFAWVVSRRAVVKTALFTVFALVGVLAYFQTTQITPRIDLLRRDHKVATPAFQQMHRWARDVYESETVVLALGGLLLSLGIRADRDPSN